MDTINRQDKIPPLILEKTMISQKTDEKEPQREPPGHRREKRPQSPALDNPEEKQTGEKNSIDILV